MICFNCDKFELKQKNIILSMDFRERIIVIKKVPASVCEFCGAEYIDPPVDMIVGAIINKTKNSNITDDIILDYSEFVDDLR